MSITAYQQMVPAVWQAALRAAVGKQLLQRTACCLQRHHGNQGWPHGLILNLVS